MDLFGNPQSIVAVAFTAASCFVAGGWLARGREAKRSKKPTVPGAALGPRVMVVGVLKVEGLCCSRFEDAVPVAATTFQQRRRDGAQGVTWCNRARRVWVDVGEQRVAIEGPIRVDVGSEEQYPGCPLPELRGRIVQRIFASQMVPSSLSADPPNHGVFRSVRPDDQVVVVGRVVRDGGRWVLSPDDTGAVTLCYRRRPTVRGALFKLHAWAAAILIR
jgi:hypothetical protein